MRKWPHEYGESVKCLDGGSRPQYAVAMCIDGSMQKFKTVTPAEASVDDLLDVIDIAEATGKAPATVGFGRGKELLVEPGTVFYLRFENRDPHRMAHAIVKMNGDPSMCHLYWLLVTVSKIIDNT